MRQVGRLSGSVSNGRSVPGPWPGWLTHISRGGAESKKANDWPPLAAGTMHHTGANLSRCGTAPRARLATSIPADRSIYLGGAEGDLLRTNQNNVPRSVSSLSDSDDDSWALLLAPLVNFAYA